MPLRVPGLHSVTELRKESALLIRGVHFRGPGPRAVKGKLEAGECWDAMPPHARAFSAERLPLFSVPSVVPVPAIRGSRGHAVGK